MKTTQLRILSNAAGKPAASARRNGKSHVFRNLIVVPADTGEEAVALAAADLRKYLKLAGPGIRVTVKNGAAVSGDDLRGNSLILLGNANTNGLIRRTQQAARLTYRISYRERYQEITGVPLKDPGAGFSVRTITSPYSRHHSVILLEGEDKLGVQYAAYDWLEKAVGVRFLSPYFVKCRNRSAKLRLSVLKQGENVLMMSTDLPLISPYYFKARQHDFDRLSGDSVTFGHDVNLYTTRKLEWLKMHYSFRGQWRHAGTWEQSVAGEVDHLFGDGVGARMVDALKSISRVLEQDLVWRKTPYNHDTLSYRGIQTFFPSLVHIFTNCAQHPLDLMELRGKNGGVWNMAASGPEEVRLKRRPYRDFVDRDHRTVKRDTLHYLKLLAQAEESLRTAAYRIQRNRDFFEGEFAYNLRGALDFLGWRLKAVTTYCLLIEAEKHARRYDQQPTLATMRQALAHMSEAVQILKSYWTRYGVKEELIERSWGEASPAPRQVEALYRVWQKLDEATRGDGQSWNTALIRYVNVTDRYPDLFSNQPRVVGKKNDLFGCSLFTQIGEDE